VKSSRDRWTATAGGCFNHTQTAIQKILEPQKEKLRTGERSASTEFLKAMNHGQHDGLPGDFVGINLNTAILQKHIGQFESSFIKEAREMSDQLDIEMQTILGAKVCALKMFYPAGGYIQWHTNWDAPGYNVIFTHSENGLGYWRHVNPEGSTSVRPNLANLVHIDDPKGWHCKIGYFGKKTEPERVVWHSAFTAEPRLTLSYIIYEKVIWENLVEELDAQAAD
jgi:hypothetical protein